MLGGGDINLYSLFVERAMRLVKPDGIVGLLTPSGIYADKTAARFFKSVSTSGRVGGLFDFENRRLGTESAALTFPTSTPASNSAPSSSAAKSAASPKPNAPSSFTTPPPSTTRTAASLSPPPTFARVNPNTGTAPVFRTRRDADITRRIYERHPVLVDRSGDEEYRVWPVQYLRMFDMANDSHLFRTAAQLDTDGFYPVQGGNHWKRGDTLYLPLYEGKMVQAFDHRAASVAIVTLRICIDLDSLKPRLTFNTRTRNAFFRLSGTSLTLLRCPHELAW